MSIRRGIPTGQGSSLPPTTKGQGQGQGQGQQDNSIDPIQVDIQTLSQKIFDIESATSGKSPFVASLRAAADENKLQITSGSDKRLHALEKLLEKIQEYDRVILKKTAPEESQTTPRRKSRGIDLSTIPTYLHITDRLLDLHSQSQRVTVLTQSEKVAVSQVSQPEDLKLIDSLRDQLGTANKQVKEIEGSSAKSEKEITSLNAKVSTLEEKLRLSEEKHRLAEEQLDLSEESIIALNQAPKSSAQPNSDLAALREAGRDLEEKLRLLTEDKNQELDKLREENESKQMQISVLTKQIEGSRSDDSRVKELEREIELLHQRLEEETGRNQTLLDVIVRKAALLREQEQENWDQNAIGDGSYCNLTPDFQLAFKSLDGALSGIVRELVSQVRLISSVKDLLEDEVSSSQYKVDMISKDFTTLTQQFESMKSAYHSLEAERTTTFKQAESAGSSRKSVDHEGVQLLTAQLDAANDKVVELQGELFTASRRSLELEKLVETIQKLQDELRVAQHDKQTSDAISKSYMEEVASYKRLSESLKQKIREMSKGSNIDIDSFEEVMKEEMMAMKEAFTAKLNIAKEEAELTSKRHRAEIARMSASSPYMNIR